MSQILIHEYLRQLDLLKKVSGSTRETILREAFKDLLKAWGRQEELVFIAEYPLKTSTNADITVDGALLHELRVPLGYWEAKDERDDLDAEIEKKFRKGYPQDNIVFTDDLTAVLIQKKQEVMRCDMTDTSALASLLELFFAYVRPEIASFRAAVEQFKTDLPAVLDALRDMINEQERSNAIFQTASKKFLSHAKEAINPELTEADVREMLIQHILTEEIFAKVFDSDFHRENNVAKELYALENVFFTGALKRSTLKALEPYYAAIRSAAAQIAGHHEKQSFLKAIYENFYKVYNVKAADRLGVVYTPNEVVRFMVDATDWLCQKHFKRALVDRDVDILDPATGTGTFICELIEHFRGQKKRLEHKYKSELHANEVAILPYYVANLNIEATYAAVTGSYDEFPNLCFVDTLDNVGLHTAARGTTADLFGSVSDENVARIKRQNSRRISVVIGNPPYNANQASENDNNKNREYPAIDKRVKDTYIASSNAQKTKLYDMYSRFFRWASDRLDANGILAFVTNRSFINSKTFDGFRRTVAAEFSEIYIVDLGGDVRLNPKLSGTRHNVFGIQTGVAISFMVKKEKSPKEKQPARIFYLRRPEMETADEKLSFLSANPASSLTFEEITPDKSGNWVNLSTSDFHTHIPLISKEAKAATSPSRERAVFKLFSNGINTARDSWVIDDDRHTLSEKVRFFLDRYDAHSPSSETFDGQIKWSRNLKTKLSRDQREEFDAERIGRYAYRPFFKNYLYRSPLLIDELGLIPAMMRGENTLLVMPATGEFRTLATNLPCDFHFIGDARAVPLYRFSKDGEQHSNVTDWGLRQFTAKYKPAGRSARKIAKDDVAHYCYAVLHDPWYRSEYALDLKREYPRVPLFEDFWQWAEWGRQLVALHVGYESLEPWALTRHDEEDQKARAAGQGPRPVLRSDHGSGSIVVDTETTLRGVPPEAWTYRLGARSALDWILDQYKERKSRDSTVRSRFDTFKFSDYKDDVILLLGRVTRVSVETMRIVEAMKATKR